MALPKIKTPTFEVIVPSTKVKIIMRPYLVKEEKILLMALASEDINEMARATTQIVNNCIITEGVDVDKLQLFDIDFLLLQIRIQSVGNTIKISFHPRENTKCAECSKSRELEVDLREARVETNDAHSHKFNITADIGLIMRYPTLQMQGELYESKTTNDIDGLFKLIWKCIEAVYEGDSLMSTTDVSVEEGVAFLESLNSASFKQVEQFFETMPRLKQVVKIKCNECGYEEDYTMEGLDSFFV